MQWQQGVLSGSVGGVMLLASGPGVAAATGAPGGVAAISALILVGAAGVLLALWLLRSRGKERVRAERELRSSEERLKLALWGTGDELWDLDVTTHRLRRANPLPQVKVGPAEEVGDVRSMAGSVHPDDLPGFETAMRDLLRGDSDHLDFAYRAETVDGGWCWLRTRGRVVVRDAEGRATRVAGTVADITELQAQQLALERLNHELEERVVERTQALSAANGELEDLLQRLTLTQDQLVEQEKMAALGGLVAGVAHEINTPLGIGVTAASHLASASQRMAEALAEKRLTRSGLEDYARLAQESAQLILRNLERADKLVKSFKQVAVDQATDERRRFDLAEYLDEVVTSLRPALRRAHHEVDIEVDGHIALDTLPGALYQTLANLVQNSVIHGFAGRTAGRIRIHAHCEGADCIIDYRDDGAGMPEEVRRRVFEPFYTTRRGQGGSGLGMHIVYNLVTRALRGAISCESQPGQGCRFLLRFPRALGG
jgi:signal transduction histidine kinase